MYRFFILLMITYSSITFGQGYNTNAWPSVEHPFKLNTQLSDLQNALDERTLSWFFSSWATNRSTKSRVQYLKDRFIGALDVSYWIDTTAAPGPYSNPPPPRLTITNICEYCFLPTNFFDVTFHRFYSGLGHATNDSTVGHPHGYVTTNTQAGGPYFPPGRSVWYTSDYGVQGLHDAMSLMQKEYTSDGSSPREVRWAFNTSFTSGWTEAKAWAVTEYAANHATSSISLKIGEAKLSFFPTPAPADHYAELLSVEWTEHTGFLLTNATHVTDFYVLATNLASVVDSEIYIYDSFEMTWPEGEWTIHNTSPESTALIVTSTPMGSLVQPSPWPTEPTGSPPGFDNTHVRGWHVLDNYSITTHQFQYTNN